MRKVVEERARKVQPVAGPKLVISESTPPKQLEFLAQQMGVPKVDFKGRGDIGVPIVRGLQQAVSAGVALPKALLVDVDEFRDAQGRVNPRGMAFFGYRLGQTEGNIYINPAWPGWKNLSATMQEFRRTGWLSSDDTRHIMLHEMAHCDFVKRRLDYRNAPFTKDEDLTIASRVSIRAAVNKDEFLAEVTAARLVGRQFDEEVMALYRRMTNDARP